MKPSLRRTLTVLIATLALIAPAAAAHAATSKADVLLGWTQPTTGSYNNWNAARLNRGPWNAYAFDWSTDYCSASPDNPLGFDFRTACWRHDFGYRNYKLAGRFPANKARVDDAFYADLRRRCTAYHVTVRPACYALAWTYYKAVHLFGSTSAVTTAEIQWAAEIKAARS